MRKQDVVITTTVKAVLYAIGTAPTTNPQVWDDTAKSNYGSRQYTPGFILEMNNGRNSNDMTVLYAEYPPGSVQAERSGQVLPAEALSFDMKSHEKHGKVMEKYSRWPLSEEQQVSKQEELAKITPMPRGWKAASMRGTHVRMLWAEYETALEEAADRRKAAESKKREEAAKRRDEFNGVASRLIAHGLIGKIEDAFVMPRPLSGKVEVQISIIEALLDGYTKPVSETKEVSK